ncbi:DUF1758 domain-containing protein [Trichonephila clavipes]|nr:DUF1758 domain-containing protein [Trichonephila clavipes]
MSETEKAQMAEIRAARGRVKASLTRLENTFEEINTRNEISIRLSRLDDLFKEFERLDSNLSLEASELQEFEERYFYLNAKFNDKLDELNVQNQGRTQNSVASSITSNSNVGNFRLPKLSIPQFNRHFKDWINFKDLFVSTVHSQVSISKVKKFLYLKGLLPNEPASLIKRMPISNDSYEEAWQKLLDSTENELNTNSLLQRFWETEELSVKKQFLSDEEQFCENHFKSNFKYNDEDRFVVKLQIYRDSSRLSNTKGVAFSRLLAMERRFQVDKDFERQYKNFMIEYESLGHMIPVENNVESMDSKIYFLPHHAVMKGDSVSTKLRVVFDGTCKPSNGNSLNSILGIGKMLQPDLFTILVKFRLNEIAFSADIQQIYRQILVDQEDQNFQCIAWRESKDSPIREYKLCTVQHQHCI